jgi:hypothetical protein
MEEKSKLHALVPLSQVEVHSTPWIGGWVAPIAHLDEVARTSTNLLENIVYAQYPSVDYLCTFLGTSEIL